MTVGERPPTHAPVMAGAGACAAAGLAAGLRPMSMETDIGEVADDPLGGQCPCGRGT